MPPIEPTSPLTADHGPNPTAGDLEGWDPSAQLGVSGLRRFGHGRAHIFSEWVASLSTLSQRMATYRQMATDPVLGTALRAIELLMIRTSWRIDPHNQTDEAKRIANHVEQCLFDDDMAMTWEETLLSVLSALWAGFSYHEIVYKRRRGKLRDDPFHSSKFKDDLWGIAGIEPRSQQTFQGWVYDPRTHRLLGVRQLAGPTFRETFIPLSKALHFRTHPGHDDDPEGRSLIRNAYEPWFFAQRLRAIEGIGAERDLNGVPLAKAPASIFRQNATDAEKAMRRALEELVRNVKFAEKAGIVFPTARDKDGNDLYSFELISAGSSRAFPINEIIQRNETHMARVLMADFMMLGSSSAGSFALSADKTSLWQQAVDAVVDQLQAAFNRQVIPRILERNRWEPRLAPKLSASPVRRQDAAALAEFISKLTQTGLTFWPDNALEDYLREVAELPPVTDDVRQEREHAQQMQQQMQQPPGDDDGGHDLGPAASAAWDAHSERGPDAPAEHAPGERPDENAPSSAPQNPMEQQREQVERAPGGPTMQRPGRVRKLRRPPAVERLMADVAR